MLHNLSNTNSILSQYVSELRNIQVQTDRLRFRLNLERIGQIAAYEISKILSYENAKVTSPLGSADYQKIVKQPVIATILRAGLPLANGINNIFDQADCAFISAYRKHDEAGNFEIQLEYLACPDLNARPLILADPMLASGASIVKTLDELLKTWTPSGIHIVAAIAAQAGIAHVFEHYPNANIWVAAVDAKLNDQKYIVPGLGDAGDLAFGCKLQN